MGCGNTKQSSVGIDEKAHIKEKNSLNIENNNELANKGSQKKKKKNSLKPTEEKKAKNLSETDKPPPKPVAFEINFDDENPFKRPPPPRLSRLAPLEGITKMSHQQLMQKMDQAEVSRSKELEKRRTLSRKSSKRRMSILQAKEFEKENQQMQQAEVNHDLRLKEEKRAQILEEKREKARLQEERRRRVREKARRINEDPEEEVAGLQLERDMTFNRGDDEKDEVDSWLNDDNNDPKQRENEKRENRRDDSGNYSNHSFPANHDWRNDGNNKLDHARLAPLPGIISVAPAVEERSNEREFSAKTHESIPIANVRDENIKMLPYNPNETTDDFFDT